MISRQSISLSLVSMLIVAACGGGGGGGGGGPGGGVTTSTPGNVVAVTNDGRIITFDAGAPETVRTSTTIKNLQAGDSIIAIDVRPSTGDLIGASLTRLYRIDAVSGVSTQIAPFAAPLPPGSTMQADPTSDHVSIVTPLGQNEAFDPQTGAQPPAAPISLCERRLAAGNPVQLAAMAFTNDHPFAAHTTLFGIDPIRNARARGRRRRHADVRERRGPHGRAERLRRRPTSHSTSRRRAER